MMGPWCHGSTHRWRHDESGGGEHEKAAATCQRAGQAKVPPTPDGLTLVQCRNLTSRPDHGTRSIASTAAITAKPITHAKVHVSQSTTEPPEYLLRAPGDLTVLVEGADRRRLNVVVAQLNARLDSRTSVPGLQVSLHGDSSANGIDWGSLATQTWTIRAPATGTKRIRHLSALVRLRQLTLGLAPLHGAAAQSGDEALIVLGPAGSGKTRILMSMLEAGWKLAAGEWLVVRSGLFESIDDRIDLRGRHIDDLQQLRPRFGVRLMARRWVSRLPGLHRFDRFELTAESLGAARMEPGTPRPISKIIWSHATGDTAGTHVRSLDDILDALVTSEMSRYARLMDSYRRDAEGLPPVSVIERLPTLLRERIRANLAGLPVHAVEHPPEMPLTELARMVGAMA